jgi:flagellar protein FlgJ
MEFYQDIFDKQLSLLTSNSGTGFAKIVENNIDQQYSSQQNLTKPASGPKAALIKPLFQIHKEATPSSTLQPPSRKVSAITTEASLFNSPEEFVKTLWTSAKSAAKAIGVDPKLLLAQAALETNWGKKILPHGKGNSSFNLFNIKADHSWKNPTTTMDTLEQKDGVLSKVKSTFRSYNSFVDSFKDYVQFLKQNGRYSDALKKAGDPHQFIHALQSAGYATDTNYAEKILNIFASQHFKSLVGKLE